MEARYPKPRFFLLILTRNTKCPWNFLYDPGTVLIDFGVSAQSFTNNGVLGAREKIGKREARDLVNQFRSIWGY
jgi:hypothetical protein